MSRAPTAEEKRLLHGELEAERLRLEQLVGQSKHAEQPVELDQNRQGRLSRMDALAGQAMHKSGLERAREQIKEIDSALARLVDQDFGRCFECDEWIPIARLMLSPMSRYCVACASQNENV